MLRCAGLAVGPLPAAGGERSVGPVGLAGQWGAAGGLVRVRVFCSLSLIWTKGTH